MVEIECLLCEKPIKLPKDSDTENYDGDVVCKECQLLFHIKLVKGKLQKCRVKQRGFRKPSGEQLDSGLVVELFKMLTQKQKELREEESKHD